MDNNFSQWLNTHFDHLKALLGDNASCFVHNEVEPEELEPDYHGTSGITKELHQLELHYYESSDEFSDEFLDNRLQVTECEVHTGKGRIMDND